MSAPFSRIAQAWHALWTGGARAEVRSVQAVDGRGGWFNIIAEGLGAGGRGGFQQHVQVDDRRRLVAFSAVYACATLIAADIAKLRVKLVRETPDGICTEADTNTAHLPVIKKPNGFQNRIQYWEHYFLSKLLHGNTYVLKIRDRRGLVVAKYVLDPERVTPLVTDGGDVYYRLAKDPLSQLPEISLTVPASEIIHDRMNAFWHPLVGVSPIYACGLSAMMGNRIQSDSVKFFQNMSLPSGGLTAPGTIGDETANRLKRDFEERFGGENIGRLFVAGDGLKYEAMKIPAADAQLIEQLKWTVEDVGRAFHVPLYKIGGPIPLGSSVEALQQSYYSDCLQTLIEAAELCEDEGLGLPTGMYTEFDLDGLLRMDTAARYESINKAIAGAWLKPNEARQRENLPPVTGGDALYMQQQNFSLEALAKRDALPNPFVIDRSTTNPTPSSEGPAPAADPKANASADQQAAEFLTRILKGVNECSI